MRKEYNFSKLEPHKNPYAKRLKKIPKFKSEQEEREFWLTHDTTEYLDWSKAVRVKFPNLKPTKF